MLFKSEKEMQEDGKRFLSWRNAYKVLLSLMIFRIIYILVRHYYYDEKFVWGESFYWIVMEFFAPGTLEIQGIMERLTTWKYFDPVNHPTASIFILIGFIFFIQFSLNPSLRNLIFEKIVTLPGAIKNLFSKNKNANQKPWISKSGLIPLLAIIFSLVIPFASLNMIDHQQNQYLDDLKIDLNKRYKKDELYKDQGKYNQKIEDYLSIILLNGRELKLDGDEIDRIKINYQSEDNLPRGEKGYFDGIDIYFKNVPLDKLREKVEQFGETEYDIKFKDWYEHRLDKNEIPSLSLDNWHSPNNGVQTSISIHPTYNDETTAELRISIDLEDEYFGEDKR